MRTGADDAAQSPVSERRRRVQRGLFAGALVVFGVGTVVGSLTARHEARQTADRRGVIAARQAATALEREINDVIMNMSGAAAIVTRDGELDLVVFDTFARDVLSVGHQEAVALIGVVDQEDRSGFEATFGGPITAPASGRPVADAPTYYPVLAVHPSRPAPAAVGTDLAGETELRRVIAHARETGDVAVSAPTRLPVTGDRGLVLLRPLKHRAAGGSELVGFVAAGLPLDRLEQVTTEAAGPSMEITVSRGGDVVTGAGPSPDAAAYTEPAIAADASWDVAARPRHGPDFALAWLLASGGAVATAAVAALLWATERHQHALAVSNSRLALSEARSRAVQEVASELAHVLSADDVMDTLVQHLPNAVQAHRVAIGVAEGDAMLIWDDERRGARVPLSSGSPVRRVLDTGSPASWPSRLEWRDDRCAAVLAGDSMAMAVLPFAGGDDPGVLAVGYDRVHFFADEEMSVLTTLSLLAARAISRGRRFDTEHDAAVEFQRAALPAELPDLHGLSVKARYRPATRQAAVGGDWYDVIALADDRTVLIVGDVVGHGMTAAATMGRLRTAFHVIASMYSDPAQMLTSLNQQASAIPNAFCTTVACAVIDHGAATLTWSRAGHLPPVLLSCGRATLLDAAGTAPLGVSTDAVAPGHRRPIRPGDAIVLYTDGLVERRGEDIDHSLQRLSIVAETLADLAPDDFCTALVEALVPEDQQRDDIALLVARYEPPLTGAHG